MKRFLLIFGFVMLASCESTPNVSPDLEAKKQDLRKLADADKANGDYNGASKLETQIIGLDINDPNSFITLGITLKKQGYKARALELLQTGERLNPTNEPLQFEVAKTMLENGQPQPAIDKLESLKTMDDTDDYYNSLGVAYDMTGNHQAAQKIFKDALVDSPDNGLMLNNLALSYILEGNYKEAIIILEPLTKRPDAKPKYRQNLALAYAMAGRNHEAYLQLIKDLPKDKAEENLSFYKKMRR